MKKHLLLTLSLLMAWGSASALPKGAGSPKLMAGVPEGVMAPVWSPSGDKIAFTTDNYTGIMVIDANGQNLKSVTNEPGAGYKMAWSSDGKQILGRVNIVENYRTFHEVKLYDIAAGKATTVVVKTRALKGVPTWKGINQISIADKAGLRYKTVGKPGASKPVSVSAYDLMMNDPAGAASQLPELKQFAGKIIINPALSADGNKVAFQIPGKGIFVCNSDGSGVKQVAKGSHPSWLADGKSIVVSRVSDDGTRFTASELYAIDIESGKEVLLTGNSSIIPLTPAVSPDGKKVVFENATDAKLYIIDLKY